MNPWQFEPHESDGPYERLRFLGDFGLSIGKSFLHNSVEFPDRTDHVLVGSTDGLDEVALTFKVLPDSQAQSLLVAGEEQSLCKYLYFFFIRHNSPEKKPFICPHPLLETDLLWIFKESAIRFENIAARLWSAGFPLEQYTGDQEPFTDTSENPNTI